MVFTPILIGKIKQGALLVATRGQEANTSFISNMRCFLRGKKALFFQNGNVFVAVLLKEVPVHYKMSKSINV